VVAKILVSMDERLLARIDRAARQAGLSRSAYLSRLAARELEAAGGPGTDRRARRGLAALDRVFSDHPAPEETTTAIRAERDSR
jgi:metal-responsive CopG/Arc/MetJ family transcriptional regulator